MSITKLAAMHPHPRDAFIDFEPDSHTYSIRDQPPEKKYTSVTTWNHSHFAEFDADAIIKKMKLNNPASKYYGQTPEQIKTGWEKNRDEAAAAGTEMHYLIECYYNYQTVDDKVSENNPLEIIRHIIKNKLGPNNSLNDFYPIVMNHFHNFVLDFQRKFPQYRPYRTEWTIYYEELQLAGSIDMVFENTEDGSLFIYDWKRTKEIKKQSAYMTFALTDCISHLPDTNFWHYALQLNTYKTILERKYQKNVTALMLVVLHPDNKNYQLVPVPILKDEMNDLFALRLSSL